MIRIAFLSYDWDYEIMASYYTGMKSIVDATPDLQLVVFHAYGLYEDLSLQEGALELFSLCDLQAYDGFVIQGNRMWPPAMRQEMVDRIHELGKPVVSINYELEGACFVGTSNYDAMHDLVAQLLRDCHLERPAFVNGFHKSKEAQDRKRGFLDACAEVGIVDPTVYEAGWEIERGVEVAERLLEHRDELPDALICCNDDLAAGVQQTLLEAGVRIPEDVITSGFDNRENSLRQTPRITTVDRNYEGIGRLALQTVLDAVAVGELPDKVYSPAKLMLASSCGYADDPAHTASMLGRFYDMDYELKRFYDMLSQFQPTVLSADSIDEVLRSCERFFPHFGCDAAYLTLNNRYLEDNGSDQMIPYGSMSLLAAVGGARDGLRKDSNHVYARFPSRKLLPHEVPMGPGFYIVFPLRHNTESVGTMVIEGLPVSVGYGYLTFVLTLLANSLASVRKRLILQKVNKRLDGLYVHDHLTGLFNRFGLDRFGTIAYEHLLRDFGEAQFIFVDVDNMKKINDSYGHELGDQALRDAAMVIERAILDENAFAMRYGGDEFLLICRHDLRDKLIGELRELKANYLRPYDLCLSMGLVRVRKQDDLGVYEAVELADSAMYRSKRDRRQQREEK